MQGIGSILIFAINITAPIHESAHHRNVSIEARNPESINSKTILLIHIKSGIVQHKIQELKAVEYYLINFNYSPSAADIKRGNTPSLESKKLRLAEVAPPN
jgi:hypothetical protein